MISRASIARFCFTSVTASAVSMSCSGHMVRIPCRNSAYNIAVKTLVESAIDAHWNMTPTFRRTTHSNALALSACLLITVMTFARPAANAAQWQPLTLRFDMPSQPLPTALVAFGELTGYSVLVSSDLTSGRTAAAVHGDYTPAEALQRLLAGTRLGVRFSGSKAFTLQALAAEPEPSPAPVAEEGQAQVPVPTYAAVLQRSVTRALCQLDAEDFGHYRLALQLWLDARGKVSDVRMLESSGVTQRDRAVLQRLRTLVMDGPPPIELPQPLTILLTPRPDPAADCLLYRSRKD